jgi:hypothetical protein
MHAPENEPVQQDIERLVTDEERQALADPAVPDDVKAEIMDRLNRFRESDIDESRAEDARNEP